METAADKTRLASVRPPTLASMLGQAPAPMRRFVLNCVLTLGAATLCSNGWAAPSSAVSLEGPDVTIIASQERVIYEYRQNGQLRMVRVVPTWGKPYYLVPADPTKGFGDLERVETLLPSWTLLRF